MMLIIIPDKRVEQKNGVATLMHLPKGYVWKLEPLLTYKNAPRQSVCIATFCEWMPFPTSFASQSNLFQISFPDIFGKCEIKANASATRDFSPKSLQR